MSTTKQIICLANSRKHSGRCVAGTEWRRPLSWVRPISARVAEELSCSERVYETGGDPQLLDIMAVPLLEPHPKGHQSENWLLDATERWVKIGKASWTDLEQFACESGPLWINGDESGRGLNNRIMTDDMAHVTDSLRLVHVPCLIVRVSTFGAQTRVDGKFSFDGTDYVLNVTDPSVENAYRTRPRGEYRVGECYLTISLGEEYRGHHYKLIVGVITKNG